jgi:hypothetical protein
MPKPKKIPAYLTAEEIRRLFAVIESPRDRSIFRVNLPPRAAGERTGHDSGYCKAAGIDRSKAHMHALKHRSLRGGSKPN